MNFQRVAILAAFSTAAVFSLASCISGGSSGSARNGALVDMYGQTLSENWEGKIKDDAQLRADADAEGSKLPPFKIDEARFDKYGGVKDGRPFKATGFFRIEKTDGRWWLITPEGNRFFMKGVDAICHEEGGYGTPLKNLDGSSREVFSDLPDRASFPEAYRGGKVNFLSANLKRKYGPEFQSKWRDVALRRLQDWGFNSTGQWGWGVDIGMPYVEDLIFKKAARVGRSVDPFDPGFAAAVESGILSIRSKCKDDPMLIGYCFENENGWTPKVMAELLKSGSGCHAKKALLEFLLKRNGNDIASLASSFGMEGASFDELLAKPLSKKGLSKTDAGDFMLEASRLYHGAIAGILRRHDPNHLFFGASHCDIDSMEWIEGAKDYVDAYSLHEYTLKSMWKPLFGKFADWGRPVLILEYSFVEDHRGMPSYNAANTVSSQSLRGLAYRIYTEEMASDPLVMGLSWFLYYDQPSTMRSLPHGENYNFGLVNQCDQPYYEMLREMKVSNARLHAVHAGSEKPVDREAFGCVIGSNQALRLIGSFVKGSMDGAVSIDHTNADYFNGEGMRLKIDERMGQRAGWLRACAWDAGEGRAFKSISFKSFLWKDLPDQSPSSWFLLEESSDNVSFSPVELNFKEGVKGEFNEWLAKPAAALRPDARFLRCSLMARDASKCWANQISSFNLK